MHIVHQSQLPFVGMSHQFVGVNQGSVRASIFIVLGEPGRGTRLHKHHYDKIVYVISGRSKWTVGDEEGEAKAGDVLVVKAGQPHKFVCAPDDPVRQIDIHMNPTFETEWLE